MVSKKFFVIRKKIFFLSILIPILIFSPQSRLYSQVNIEPDEIDAISQIDLILEGLNYVIEEFLFRSIASAIPLIPSATYAGSNDIGLIAPNPYFRISLIGGAQAILPVVNFSSLDATGALADEDQENTYNSIDFGPLAFIRNQGGSSSISLPTLNIFFGLRFSILNSGIDFIDRTSFGIFYSAPQLHTDGISKFLGDLFALPYQMRIEMYALTMRTKVYSDQRFNIAVGGTFSYVKHNFSSKDRPDAIDLDELRTRRVQDITPGATEDQASPKLGPYKMILNYGIQSIYYVAAADVFSKMEFGFRLFRPFVILGVGITMSELLNHNSYYAYTVFEEDTLNLNAPIAVGTNIIISSIKIFNSRKSGISVLTPKISLGFNTLKVLNLKVDFSFLRAESIVPAIALDLHINIDF